MAFKAGDRIGFSGKPWPQYPAEVDAFMELLVAEGVRSYLEVGCRYGDTFHAVGCALPTGARLVALDLPGGARGLHADSGTYLGRAAADLMRRGQDAQFILGNSHDPDLRSQVTAFGPYDAVFLDGDHTDEGVRADWADYGSLGRIVAFHDLRNRASVATLWRQLKPHYRTREISVHPKLRGIGVLWTETLLKP